MEKFSLVQNFVELPPRPSEEIFMVLSYVPALVQDHTLCQQFSPCVHSSQTITMKFCTVRQLCCMVHRILSPSVILLQWYNYLC